MHKIVEIFTPERRQQIQIWLASLAPLLILGGFATQEQTEQYLIISGAVLQFIASVLSLVNVRKGDWGAGWAILRAAIYGLIAVVSPALVFFGLYSPETNAALLAAVSLALSSLSSLLAIFIGKSQELAKVEAVAKAQGVIVPKTEAGKNQILAEFAPAHTQGLD